MKTAFYTVALGAALLLTASTASVRAEDRDCTVDLKSMCAGIAPGEGHIRACIQAHMSELTAKAIAFLGERGARLNEA